MITDCWGAGGRDCENLFVSSTGTLAGSLYLKTLTKGTESGEKKISVDNVDTCQFLTFFCQTYKLFENFFKKQSTWYLIMPGIFD